MSILEAADGVSERAIVAEHVGIAATEAQDPRTGTGNRTRPIVAERANIEERTTAEAAVARHRQLQRGVEGPGSVITAPA